MAFFYQLDKGCFGCTLRSTVHLGLLHYMLHGLFIVSFVFSNSCYPPFYYPDYLFGISGGVLILVSFFATFVSNLENFQWLRSLFGILIVVVVFTVVTATFIYALERWHDVISTALTRSLRKPLERDFPDYFWCSLVIISCLVCFILLLYLIYILSYLCNENQPSCVTNMCQSGVVLQATSPGMSVPPDTYSTQTYKPYPSQRPE